MKLLTAGTANFARSRESIAIAVTTCRLFLGIPLLYGVVGDQALALVALIAIVVVDVADGVFARALQVESPHRRLVDAGVDKMLIHSAAITGVLVEPQFLWLYAPFLARDFMLVIGDTWSVVNLKAHIAGSSVHRASSAAIALVAVFALTMPTQAVIVVGVAACLINYALLPDYIRTFRMALARGSRPELEVYVTRASVAGCNQDDQSRLP
jgi:phosphatidylglycerophosphate synthase